MKCEDCGERPASVHWVSVVNGEKAEAHLCEECARQKGGEQSAFSSASFGFTNLLSNFFESGLPGSVEGSPQTGSRLRCPNCGLSMGDFRKLGQFGCSVCYETFERQLEPLLRRIQGTTEHVGKVPSRVDGPMSIRRKIEELRRQLQDAITREEYERAARLRDEVRVAESALNARSGNANG